MSILITGGAGYIGSHATRHLAEAGESIVVLDNLVLGHRDAIVSPGVELVEGDLGDSAVVESIFSSRRIEAVMHFAAWALVGESVAEPLKYYANNVAAPLVLLDAMRRHGTRQFIFSSTAATYGNPVRVPMDEAHPQEPINSYGHSKLMLERILRDCHAAWGLNHVILRYFNACGCSEDGLIGEDHDPETHLIPRALMAAAGTAPPLTVFGRDYPTPDGTCLRDYIHVEDLASAHAKALAWLRGGGTTLACNLGTGTGISVQEIIDHAEAVTGLPVPREYGPRRAGDPPSLVADPSLAQRTLGWSAAWTDPQRMIESAWRWISGPGGGRYASSAAAVKKTVPISR
jgi:UDP-glucose-4-epimerase GalE